MDIPAEGAVDMVLPVIVDAGVFIDQSVVVVVVSVESSFSDLESAGDFERKVGIMGFYLLRIRLEGPRIVAARRSFLFHESCGASATIDNVLPAGVVSENPVGCLTFTQCFIVKETSQRNV